MKRKKFWMVTMDATIESPRIGDPVTLQLTLKEAMDYARDCAKEVQGTYYVMQAVRSVTSVFGEPEVEVLK